MESEGAPLRLQRWIDEADPHWLSIWGPVYDNPAELRDDVKWMLPRLRADGQDASSPDWPRITQQSPISHSPIDSYRCENEDCVEPLAWEFRPDDYDLDESVVCCRSCGVEGEMFLRRFRYEPAALAVRSDSSRDTEMMGWLIRYARGASDRAETWHIAMRQRDLNLHDTGDWRDCRHVSCAANREYVAAFAALAACPAPDETTGDVDTRESVRTAVNEALAASSVAPLIETRKALQAAEGVLFALPRSAQSKRRREVLAQVRKALAAVSVTPEPPDSGSRGALSSETDDSLKEGTDDE